MRRLEEQMAAQPDKALLAEYDALSTRFQTGGGYETDMQTDKICNGLGIPAAQRQQDFDSLSGGEKTRVNLARLLLEKDGYPAARRADEPSGYARGRMARGLY